MPTIVWIALGGAAGTVCRAYVSTWMLASLGAGFPYGTFTVNLVGSLLLGVLFGVGQSSDLLGPTAMVTLSTGFMGGFTTYSTFSLDTFKLLQAGSWTLAALYVGLTVGACLAATAAGFAGAQRWLEAL